MFKHILKKLFAKLFSSHHKYSSSDYGWRKPYHPHSHHGHSHYGKQYYKKKHSSFSIFSS